MEGAVDSLEKLVETPFEVTCEGDTVRVLSVANLPTRSGLFRIVALGPFPDGREHIALVRGDVVNQDEVLVRVHSECLTGDVLGSMRCDCRDQLEMALDALGRASSGVLLYLRQEGRGVGLIEKIRAYTLQDQGMDTVQANLALGHPDDLRDYTIAADMLRALQVRSIRLMTNNPDKVNQLRSAGVEVRERVAHEAPVSEHNRRYLRTKMERSGHLLNPVALSSRKAGK